ncbi:hypothetical protein JCM5350_000541 [Sporobolomyces pararoseus]
MSRTAPLHLTEKNIEDIEHFLALKKRLDQLNPAVDIHDQPIFNKETGSRKYMDKFYQIHETLTVPQGSIYDTVSGHTRVRNKIFFQTSPHLKTEWVRCPDKNTKEIYHPETGTIETIHYPDLPSGTIVRASHSHGIQPDQWY